MSSVVQNNFTGGELSPGLYNRRDLKKFPFSLRKSRNGYVDAQGAWMNRPGFQYLGVPKFNATKSRLVPFIFSSSAAYVLEIGALYIRFWYQGALVDVASVPVEVVTPYVEADIWRLKFSQVGNVIVITHPSYTPRELRRNSHTSWTISTASRMTELWDSARVDGTGPVPADFQHEKFFLTNPLPTEDLANGMPALEWTWQVTAIIRENTTNLTYETSPFTITQQATYVVTGDGWTATPTALPAKIPVYPSKPVTIDSRKFNTPGLYVNPGYKIVSFRFYRGRGNLMGLIGEINPINTGYQPQWLFTDRGDTPDYSTPPPQGRNPLEVRNYDETLVRTEEPALSAHFSGRRVFARTDERPTTLMFSQTDDYDNFDKALVLKDTHGFDISLANMIHEEIRALVPLKNLLVMTSAGEWAVGGVNSPLSPLSVNAAQHTRFGCSWVDPLVVGGYVFFIQPKGNILRALRWDDRVDGYEGTDISWTSRHFFDGYDIVDRTFMADPDNLGVYVRSDGSMLVLTWMPEQEISGWSLWTTNGIVESVAAIPEGTEDRLYAIIRRTINGVDTRFIERLRSRRVTDYATSVMLDCSAVAEATVPHLNGEHVTLVADSVFDEDLIVTAGSVLGTEISWPDGYTTGIAGFPYTSEVEFLDVSADVSKPRIVREMWVDFIDSRGFWVGESLDEPARMTEYKQRTVDHGYSSIPLESGRANIVISGRYGTTGRACVQQRDPFPLRITAITREVV